MGDALSAKGDVMMRKIKSGFVFFSLAVSALLVFSGPVSLAERSADRAAPELTGEAFIESEAGKLFQSGKYQESLKAIDALLAQYPKDTLLLRYKGMALDRLGRSGEAIRIYRDLLTENPTHLPTRFFLAQAYDRSGEKEAALKEWRWIVKQQTGSVYEGWAAAELELRGIVMPAVKPQPMKRWYVIGRYGWEYDSNVILLQDDGTIARDANKDAGRHVLDLALRYRAFSNRDTAVDLTYATRQTFHEDGLNEYNFHSEEFGVNLRRRVQVADRDVVLGLRYEFLMGFLDDDLFSLRNRWHVSADTRFTANTRTVFYDRMTQGNYGPDGFDPARTSRDGFYNDAGMTHYWYFQNFQSYVYLREEFNLAAVRGQNFDLVGSTSRVGLHLPLAEKLALDCSGGLWLGFYPNFSSVSSQDLSRRRDIDWDLYTALTYRLTPNFGITGFYRFIDANNRNNIYDYKRHIGGVQLVYSQLF